MGPAASPAADTSSFDQTFSQQFGWMEVAQSDGRITKDTITRRKHLHPKPFVTRRALSGSRFLFRNIKLDPLPVGLRCLEARRDHGIL